MRIGNPCRLRSRSVEKASRELGLARGVRADGRVAPVGRRLLTQSVEGPQHAEAPHQLGEPAQRGRVDVGLLQRAHEDDRLAGRAGAERLRRREDARVEPLDAADLVVQRRRMIERDADPIHVAHDRVHLVLEEEAVRHHVRQQPDRARVADDLVEVPVQQGLTAPDGQADEARLARIGVELLDCVGGQLILRVVKVRVPRAEAAAGVAARRQGVHQVQRRALAPSRVDERSRHCERGGQAVDDRYRAHRDSFGDTWLNIVLSRTTWRRRRARDVRECGSAPRNAPTIGAYRK